MQNEIVELIYEARKEWDVYFNDCLLKGKPHSKTLNEFIADHLITNGVIVLPCKVGDSVYLLQKYHGTYCFNVVEDKVQMIGVTSRGIHIKARNHHDHNKMYMLGKTIFLTKEEAEQKLKGGVDCDNK